MEEKAGMGAEEEGGEEASCMSIRISGLKDTPRKQMKAIDSFRQQKKITETALKRKNL